LDLVLGFDGLGYHPFRALRCAGAHLPLSGEGALKRYGYNVTLTGNTIHQSDPPKGGFKIKGLPFGEPFILLNNLRFSNRI